MEDQEHQPNQRRYPAPVPFHSEPMGDQPKPRPLRAAALTVSAKPQKLSKRALQWLAAERQARKVEAVERQEDSLASLMSSALPRDLTNPSQLG